MEAVRRPPERDFRVEVGIWELTRRRDAVQIEELALERRSLWRGVKRSVDPFP
jgi:hypothetical protein